MVSPQACERTAIMPEASSSKVGSPKAEAPHSRRRKVTVVLPVLLTAFLMAFLVSVIVVVGMRSDNEYAESGGEESAYDFSDDFELTPEVEEPEKPMEVDFQGVVDDWAGSAGGRKGVIIYDLDLEKTVGEYDADVSFQTASLYKLFVVYAGYLKVQNGEWDGADKVSWTGDTILECLDLAIRESNSPCAEGLWTMFGPKTLDAAVQEWLEVPDFTVNNLTASPREIMKIMKMFYEHKEITDAGLVAQMKDSFLNQPVTEYDWRQGLPRGFSEAVKVYNKVGWAWNADAKKWDVYDDAAILEFTSEKRNYIVVVMTSGVTYQQIRALGTRIEERFYSFFVS